MRKTLTVILWFSVTLFALTTCEGSFIDPGTLEMLGGGFGNGGVTLPLSYSSLYGTWVSTTGSYQPYTLTISANTIKWQDKSGNFVQYTDVQWGAKTANTNATYRTNYPEGFTFTGTLTYKYYTSVFFGFIALSTDGRSVYVGTSAATAAFRNHYSGYAGSIYTRQ